MASGSEHRQKAEQAKIPQKKDNAGKSLVLSEEFVQDSDTDTDADPTKEELVEREAEEDGSSDDPSSKNDVDSLEEESVDANAVFHGPDPSRRDSESSSKSSDLEQGSEGDKDRQSTTIQKHKKYPDPVPESSAVLEQESEANSTGTDAEEIEGPPSMNRSSKTPNVDKTGEQPPATPMAFFEPPEGFKSVKIPSNIALGSILAPESLANKELWHIIAPRHVPVPSITAASLVRRKKGDTWTSKFDSQETILSHRGLDYSLVESTGKDLRQRAYLPDSGGNTFSRLRLPVCRTVRIQQQTSSKSAGPATEKSSETLPIKRSRPAPQQPPGLKIRYRPFGTLTPDEVARAKTLASSAPSTLKQAHESPLKLPEKRKKSVLSKQMRTEAIAPTSPEKRKDSTPSKFKPAQESASKSPEKRKASRSTPSESPQKISKKERKRQKQKHEAKPDSDPLKVLVPNSQMTLSQESPAKVAVSSDVEPMDVDPMDVEPPNREMETPEERAKRHAEKKQQKEEKRARKAARRARREATAVENEE